MRLFELDWLLGEKKEASHSGGLFVFRPISSAFYRKSRHYLLLHIRTLSFAPHSHARPGFACADRAIHPVLGLGLHRVHRCSAHHEMHMTYVRPASKKTRAYTAAQNVEREPSEGEFKTTSLITQRQNQAQCR